MWERVKEFFAKETVLCVAAMCAVITMFVVPPDGEYLHYIDFRLMKDIQLERYLNYLP